LFIGKLSDSVHQDPCVICQIGLPFSCRTAVGSDEYIYSSPMTLNEHRSEGFWVSVIKYIKLQEGCFSNPFNLYSFYYRLWTLRWTVPCSSHSGNGIRIHYEYRYICRRIFMCCEVFIELLRLPCCCVVLYPYVVECRVDSVTSYRR
jgi:hypothetical protein